MEKQQIVKTISPTICPHCKKDIFVDFQTSIPLLAGVISMDEINDAKAEIKERIKGVKFKEGNKEQDIIDWLDRPNTLINKNDIEEILKQILFDNDNTIKDKTE